jgi:hypothetical protein
MLLFLEATWRSFRQHVYRYRINPTQPNTRNYSSTVVASTSFVYHPFDSSSGVTKAMSTLLDAGSNPIQPNTGNYSTVYRSPIFGLKSATSTLKSSDSETSKYTATPSSGLGKNSIASVSVSVAAGSISTDNESLSKTLSMDEIVLREKFIIQQYQQIFRDQEIVKEREEHWERIA